MSREIKFRAWDNYDKVMRSTEWLEKNDFALGVDGRMVVRCGDELVTRDHNMFPLQYTGRKDKNGKEIYEGDIVGNPHRSRKIVIGFKDGSYSYRVKQEAGEYKGTYKHFPISTLSTDDIVIGNIYENPELLKDN